MITTLIVDFFGVLKYAEDSGDEWNGKLIDFLAQWDKEMFMFTSSTVNRDKGVQEKLNPIFRQMFSTIELGVSKKDPNAYQVVAEKINKQPSEILFIDDTLSNIEAAKQAGLNAVVYTNFEELKSYLEKNG